MPKDKIYFTADAHLGSPVHHSALQTERALVAWMEAIEPEAKAVYFLGDMIDFWIEYRKVVPRGFVRFLAAMARLQEKGSEVHYLVGNHDLWITDYFQAELGICVHHHAFSIEESGNCFRLAHGDEEYREHSQTEDFIYKLFRNTVAQRCARALHPRWLLGLGQKSSIESRRKGDNMGSARGDLQSEWLVHTWARTHSQELANFRYLIFGHRHLLGTIYPEGLDAQMIFLGDWIQHNSYACWDGERLSLFHKSTPDTPLGKPFYPTPET